MAPTRKETRGALPLLLLLLLAAAAPAALAKYQNNFDLYPAAAQPCLYAASDASRCDGDTVAVMNRCLCSDARGRFVSSAAACIGRDAPATLRTVHQSMSTACSDSKSPIALSEDQFLALGAAGATASSLAVTPSATTGGATVTVTTAPTSSSSSTTTTTTTTPPGPETSSSSAGLSTTAKIGVGVGAGVALAALLGLAAFVWRLKRSRDAHDESHRPMLGGGVGAVGGRDPHHGPFTEYSPPASVGGGGGGGGAYNGAQEYKSENKQAAWRPVSEITQTTSPGGAQTWATNSPQPPYAELQQPQPQPQQQQQQHAWGHHPQAAYMAPPPPPPPPQQQQQGGVFELASIPVASPPQASRPPPDAVEMPATEVQPRPARYQYPSQR
ncbi:hypothetical protein LZ30DRAFT_686906 [Colletotrichum cereale]|nr:hypothetical protein LZ30DRAFT_686906 [Colletotrichum cereale]